MIYKNFLRMGDGHFKYHLSKVERNIKRETKFLRDAIPTAPNNTIRKSVKTRFR